ncbi:15851_t:CDS:2 [Funneliformis geosporum]|uniref:14631_t:CDS:1 n=1 Tax=Funneliformis geosporum TaxID=1117311 RepID=A0A9W4SRZ9_9GLOM|nr:14631_t:CDS:2 [Funneliformis geosporum]CAI2179236.1 15851_t:CDS:2 [Funneliformis geosporum]
MDRLEIAFKNVHAFRALAAWMYTFTKESVFMIINREEIKLIYEDASRGTVMGFLKFYKNEGRQTYESVESIKVNCTYSNNEFTFEFNPECLKQALDCMAEDKRIVKMELKDHEDGHILLFTGYTTGCFERSISKFYVNLQNSPPQLPSMNVVKYVTNLNTQVKIKVGT